MKDFEAIVALRGFASPAYLELHRGLGLGGKGSLVLAGPSGGEGVSTIATELALFLAARGQRRTLLVDAHRARPATTRSFGAEGHVGLAQLLAGSSEVGESVIETRVPNLWLLPAGVELADGPVALLDRDTLAARLGKLRESFEFLVFDAAPISGTSDALLFAACCDAFALVIEAESTRREVAQAALARLGEQNIPVTGVVLNKQRFRIPETVYRRL